MLILNRYLITQWAYMVGVACLLLVSIDSFFMLVNEMRFIGHGSYDMGNAFGMMLLAIPQKIYQWFPFSLLLGTLLSLNHMSHHHELTALRANGYAIYQIAAALLKGGIVLILLVFLLGEWVAPLFERLSDNHRAALLSGGQALATAQGTWIREGEDYIHIGNMRVDGTLEGITQYHFDHNLALEEAIYAKSAYYEEEGWQLEEVQSSRFLSDHIEIQTTPLLLWQTSLKPETLRIASVNYLEQLSVQGLWQAIRYRNANGLDANPYELAFWKKITQPFACMVMILVAIPFVFGPLRSATTGLRLLVGVFVGLFYHTLNAFLGPFTLLYGLPPLLGALFPTLLFGMGAAYCLYHMD